MADLNRIADLLMPGLRAQQLRLEEVSAYLDQIITTLRKNADKDNWLNMDIAPENVAVLVTDGALMAVAIQSKGIWYSQGLEFGGTITCWMPLPKPPVMEDDKDQWPLADDK